MPLERHLIALKYPFGIMQMVAAQLLYELQGLDFFLQENKQEQLAKTSK